MLGMRSRSSRSRCHGILVQKAHGGVEGRAAPHFQAEQIRQAMRDGGGGGEQVVRAHARGQQRLVRVAKSGVGDQQALFAARPFGETLRGPSFCRSWRVPSGAARRPGQCGITARLEHSQGLLTFHFGIAVEDHVAQIGEQLRGAVAAARRNGTAPAIRRETTW